MQRTTTSHIYVWFISFVLPAVMLGAASQPKHDPGASISQTLRSIERAWLDAEKNHDSAAFEKLVADDWIGIGPDGKSRSKAEAAAEIKTAHMISATMGDMNVRVFGETAVVTASDDEITMEDGKKSSEHYVWTDVFVERNGKWLLVASQTAQIK